MNLEEQLSNNNEFYFFKEFTFSKTRFKRENGQEVEMADNVLMIGDMYIIYQLKERFEPKSSNGEKEKTWFANKIIKKACGQIKDSLKYIQGYDEVILENNRGHKVNVATKQVKNIHKVVVYKPSDLLPSEILWQKSHKSSSAGVIHLFCINDYFGVVEMLMTPSELHEYLIYREQLILRFPVQVNQLPEKALLGQYFATDKIIEPKMEYADYLKQIDYSDTESWDMSGIISKFPERIIGSDSANDYYPTLVQIAQLKRNELRVFKERFNWCIENLKTGKDSLPYRFSSPRLDCGFIFITELSKDKDLGQLEALTSLHKYDQKNRRCIGVIFSNYIDGYFDADWCYIDSIWEKDSEIEQILELHVDELFYPITSKKVNTYWREISESKQPLGQWLVNNMPRVIEDDKLLELPSRVEPKHKYQEDS